ncbi:hypothetical protein ACFW9D_34345 [Streptomyces sp. NPDC059524]|uniref:hypothetical protein n=1 Tax=Streptomyces sp. NPDC059524 TaxID=3346856 RepID=UPI0036745B9F
MNGIRVSATARLLIAAAMTACLLASSAGVAVAAASPSASTDAWGKTKKWSGGLSVTVSKPVKFTPSPYSIGHTTGNRAVKWRITVHNGSDEAFQGALMTVNVKAGPDGDVCTQIFDGDLGGGITGSVSPGSNGTADFAFDIPRNKLKKVDVEVVPEFLKDGKHWVGSVK